MPLLKNESDHSGKDDFQLRWYKVRNRIRDEFGQRPTINAMLFLIGLNEVGLIREKWEKEEKQDLIHVAVCTLFEKDGYFRFLKKDADGFPHFESIRPLSPINIKEQEVLLKQKIVEYFEAL